MKQRGAIFGLDLRMAIVIGGLMATVLSTELLSDFEGDRQEQATKKIELLRDALLARYASSTTTTFTSTLSTLFSDGYLDGQSGYYAGNSAEQAATDPWGTTYSVSVVSASKTILGASVTSHFGILVSAGADRSFQSSTTIASEAAFQTWAPAGDDIGLKFNTVLLDRNRVLLMQQRLRTIMDALITFAQRTETAAAADCVAANCGCDDASPVACSGLVDGSGRSLAYCDRTGDGYYCNNEERMMNFYPTDSVENASNPTLAYRTIRTFTTYTSGNLASMQALMTLIGLPTSFAQDHWGRTLRYDSNEYNTTAAPYTASVWYQ